MNIYVCEFFKKLKIESKLQAPVLSTNSNMHKNGVLHTNLIFQGVKNFAQSSTKFVGMIFNQYLGMPFPDSKSHQGLKVL